MKFKKGDDLRFTKEHLLRVNTLIPGYLKETEPGVVISSCIVNKNEWYSFECHGRDIVAIRPDGRNIGCDEQVMMLVQKVDLLKYPSVCRKCGAPAWDRFNLVDCSKCGEY